MPIYNKFSATGTGGQTCDIPIGHGKYIVHASVSNGEANGPERVHISWRWRDGTIYRNSYLAAGLGRPGVPVTQIFPRKIEGPGVIRSTVNHLNSHKHSLYVHLEEVY